MSAAKIANEGDVTSEQVQEEAKSMWKKTRMAKARTSSEIDTLYNKLWKDHRKFCQAYPLVIGEMVQGRYHQKAFEKYLKYLTAATWASSKDQWLRTQAHYVCILYKHIVPHYNVKDANAAEEHAFQQLKREDASWEKNAQDVKREMEEEKLRIADLKREELKEYLTRLKGDLPTDTADGAVADAANSIVDAADVAKNEEM